MKNITKNITIVIFILGLSGCGTGWCIKVDGKYGEKSGGFEYCYDPAKSKDASVPVLTNNGKDAVLLDKATLEEIKAEYEQPLAKEAKKKKIDQLLEKMK